MRSELPEWQASCDERGYVRLYAGETLCAGLLPGYNGTQAQRRGTFKAMMATEIRHASGIEGMCKNSADVSRIC